MNLLGQDSILDESSVSPVIDALERQFSPDFGANIKQNIESLRLLVTMDKLQLEVFLSAASLISLNDHEYDQLHGKIESLLAQNLEVAQDQGIV